MSDKEAGLRLIALLKDYKRIIAIIILCLLISTGLNLCLPLLSRRIMDDGFIGGDKVLLVKMVLCSLILYLVGSIIDIIKEKKRIDISSKIQYSLSEESFSHLMRMKISYFSNKNYAEILNNINLDINNMTSIADESVFFVVTQAFSMAGGVIGLFILDYRMTFLVLFFIPVKYVVMKYFAKQRKKIMDEFILNSEKYASWFGNTVGGVKEVKLFGLFDRKYKEFVEKQNELILKQKQMNMLSQWNNIMDTISVHLLTTLIYIVGSNLVFSLQLSVDSGLAEFVGEVSLDYLVGQNGAMLSGGQKQKIALARALIQDSQIIVFDEATSNTDVCSEQLINSLLYTRLKEKTVIVITHREKILSEVDQVMILDDGKIVACDEYAKIKNSKYYLDYINENVANKQ